MTETADGKYNFRQKTRPDPIFIVRSEKVKNQKLILILRPKFAF